MTLNDAIVYDYIQDIADNAQFGADQLLIMACNPLEFPNMAKAALKWFRTVYEPYDREDIEDLRNTFVKVPAPTEMKKHYEKTVIHFENEIDALDFDYPLVISLES